jgi:hypothetical protein
MPKHLEMPMNFETEDAEREFWATHDSTEYIDWDEAVLLYLPDSGAPILQADDALFQLSGAIDSGKGDLAERHNHYLYTKSPQATVPIRLFAQNSWSASEPEQQE